MSRLQSGGKLLRLLFSVMLFALVLSGCSDSKYEAVDLTGTESTQETSLEAGTGREGASGFGGGVRSLDGEQESEEESSTEDGKKETMAALIIGADGTFTVDKSQKNQDAESGIAGADPEAETEPADPYEAVNDIIEVTADVLNVRAEDSQSARIYVQLKAGERLPRTGKTKEWNRVIYNGKTAYVAADMVKVVEEEPETPAVEAAAEPEGESPGENGKEGQETLEHAKFIAAGSPETKPAVPFNGHIVAVDAGHQAKANAEKEPIGPDSTTMKAKMPEGAVGVDTGVKEYELTLTVAKKLEAELVSRGYQVVMIRNGHDVNLSNAERSAIANQSGADILIRLYANSMENSGIYGALTACMTSQNPYNADLHDKSYTLSKKIVDNICAQTGTKNRGVQEVDNTGAINWSEIPVSVVEMGFLSNPDEDRWLQNDGYQNKLVAGITAAVDSYFAEGN